MEIFLNFNLVFLGSVLNKVEIANSDHFVKKLLYRLILSREKGSFNDNVKCKYKDLKTVL